MPPAPAAEDPLDAADVPDASAEPAAAASAAEDQPADWSHWDIGSARRALYSGNEAVCRRVLRKLRLRWFHAPRSAMKRMLQAAGVPPALLAMVDSVVDACRVCRLWPRPG